MKVIHFVQDFSLLSQTFVYDLIKALDDESGMENEVITYRRHLAQERPYHGVRVIPQLSFPSKLVYRLLKVLGQRKILGSRVRRLRGETHGLRQYDLIHAHFGRAGYDLLKAAPKDSDLAKKMIVSLHGTDTTYSMHADHEYRDTLIAAAGKGCTFVANSFYLMEKALEAGLPPSRLRIVPNSCNDAFRLAGRSLPYTGGTLRIATVGRLVSWKGQEYLIRALPEIIASIGAVELVVIGEGSERGRLEELAAELGVGPDVRFAGGVPHAGIPGILASCHIYVQPSVRDETTGQEESSGVAILEALAVGLPVVVSDSGGMGETIGYASSAVARLVRQRESEDIAVAVIRTAKDAASFNPDDRTRVSILEKYSKRKQIDALTVLYREQGSK